MKIIKRKYLQDIIDVMGTPDIKVITGVRRSGKSELLHMFSDYVKNNDEKSNIIYIDFNLDEFDYLKDYCELIFLPRTEGISTTKIKKDLGLIEPSDDFSSLPEIKKQKNKSMR